MQITLPLDVESVVRQKVDSGEFANAEDVVRAAFVALQQQKDFGEFSPGELDELLAEGERSIEDEGALDGDDAYRARLQRRANMRGQSK
jgi:Arc/MetJ-type ribon-helix-helix transcriptional regulator